MAPPPPQDCPDLGCDYKTPSNIPTYELLIRTLENHTQYANQPVTNPTRDNTPPAAELPRPELKEGSTESDYIFFKDSWHRNKRSTYLTGQGAVDQLWACCSNELFRCVYDSSVTSSSDETDLLAAMKNLAVRVQNTLVNVISFL